MPTLTNSYHRCELLNLGSGPNGRGPFIVRQEGSVPGSTSLRQDRFLLRKDGTWVLNLIAFSLTDREKQQFLYESSSEAMTLLGGLTGDPVVEAELPPDKNAEELLAQAEATITGFWAQMRQAKSSPLSAG